MDKMSKKNKKKTGKGSAAVDPAQELASSRRTNSSAKVFKNLQSIVQQDYQRKADKKEAKASGKAGYAKGSATQDNGMASKRYKL